MKAFATINDNESGLHDDYEVWLEKLAPRAPTSQYRHNRTSENNTDAHLKRHIVGREVVVAITQANSTSARGSNSSMANLMGTAASACS